MMGESDINQKHSKSAIVRNELKIPLLFNKP